jgi:hypothetical protein
MENQINREDVVEAIKQFALKRFHEDKRNDCDVAMEVCMIVKQFGTEGMKGVEADG